MELLDAQIHPLRLVEEAGRSATLSRRLAAGLGRDALTALTASCAISAMDAVGVHGAVVSTSQLDLHALAQLVGLFPDRLVGLPGVPLTPMRRSPDEFVAAVRATPQMVGIRLAVSHPFEPERLERYRAGAFEPFLAAAERHSLPVFILMNDHLHELHDALRAHPQLTVVIDHLGLPVPPSVPQARKLWDGLLHVLELAQFSNVAIKLTAAPALSVEDYPFADVWPHARRILDAFGADRVMWGSDYTRVISLHSYRESVDFITRTDQVTHVERTQLCGATLRRLLAWPADATTRAT